MNKLIIVLLLSLLISSCKVKREIIVKKPNKTLPQIKKKTKDIVEKIVKNYANPTERYIGTHRATAQKEMTLYGVPASITLAQGILESGAGRGRLSVQANNHFGIKCHGWTGEKIYHDDDKDQECFRKYSDAKYSFRDHSLFLSKRKRYAQLFKLKQDDYKGWAKGLRAAGYATDKKYPQKLISLIERYKLYEYDKVVAGNKQVKREIFKGQKQITHKVTKNDTLYSISRAYNISVNELQAINNLRGTTISIGQILIVKPSSKK